MHYFRDIKINGNEIVKSKVVYFKLVKQNEMLSM